MARIPVLILLVLLAVPVCSQDQAAGNTEPEEYTEEEFTQILQDLRRAEIVMLGSFPLTLFLTLEFYDIYRYATNGGDYQYAPWPFRPPDAAGYSNTENLGIFLTAVSTSLLIAVADYLIGRSREKRSER